MDAAIKRYIDQQINALRKELLARLKEIQKEKKNG